MASYPVYVSHCWLPENGTDRLYGLLENYRIRHVPEFSFQLLSVSKDDPVQNLPSKKSLIAAVEQKMKESVCLIILTGLFDDYKKWIDIELEAAKKLKKPVILVEAAVWMKASTKEKRAATATVKWDVKELGEAIQTHC